MYYSGNSLNNNSGVIDSNNVLNLFDLSKGVYKIDYQLVSQDASDRLELTVNKGSISIFINHQWQDFTGTLSLQNYMNEDFQHLRLRVNEVTNFTLAVVDDGLISNPTVNLNLSPKFDFDLGDRRNKAWSAGKIDKLTGAAWYEGKVEISQVPQIGIVENIGGDDVTDWVRFSLKQGATINLVTDGAITEIVNSKNQVVLGSDDAYESNLNVFLKTGTYFLHYSSESSTVETFYSHASFSFA
jgi:hypothetical protein